MKRQQKQFIGLLLVLVLCIVAYFVVKNYAKKEQEKENETKDPVTVAEINIDQVDAFSYDYEGTTYSYQKSGDGWVCENDTSIALDTGSIRDLLGNLEKITAEETLNEYDQLSDYGLDEPQKTITVTCGEDTMVLSIGDYNEMLSEYYLEMKDDDSVYLIGSAIPTAFEKHPDDLAETETETETE